MQAVRDLLTNPSLWLRRNGPESDVVLSSQVHLSRNLSRSRFPDHADPSVRAAVLQQVLAVTSGIDKLHSGLCLELDAINSLDRQVLSERQLSSPKAVSHPDQRGLVISSDEQLSIRVNEEDHVRIQALMSGLDLQAAFDACDMLDVELDSQLDFAYSETYGFLTARPTRAGTGMRASVLVHLPALAMDEAWDAVVAQLRQQKVLVGGFPLDGTPGAGQLFQVSNEATLGQREGEIIRNLDAATRQLLERELDARRRQLSGAQSLLLDRIWRSYGILSQARLLSAQETLQHASLLLLGVQLEQLEVGPDVLDEIFSFSQEGHSQVRFQSDAGDLAIEEWRAERVRNELQGSNS